MEDSPIPDIMVGLVKSGFTAFDEFKARRGSNPSPVLPPAVPSRPSKRANWRLTPIAKHPSGAIAYLLVNTSSAIVHNAEISPGGSGWVVRFTGDSDWPGEIKQMEPLVFIATVEAGTHFGKPTAELTWQDIDGDDWRQELELTITGSPLGDAIYTGM